MVIETERDERKYKMRLRKMVSVIRFVQVTTSKGNIFYSLRSAHDIGKELTIARGVHGPEKFSIVVVLNLQSSPSNLIILNVCNTSSYRMCPLDS